MLSTVGSIPEFKQYVDNITKDDKTRVAKNSNYVDDKKLAQASHYAIIPTSKKPQSDWNSLDDKQRNILLLIYKRFLAIFMPPTISSKTIVITNNNDNKFKTIIFPIILLFVMSFTLFFCTYIVETLDALYEYNSRVLHTFF